MTQPQIEGKDLVLDVETRWASGLVLNKRKFIYGPIEDSFGHSGFGGSCAFADPQNNLGISYVMNKMENNFNSDGRSVELIHAIYKCLEK
jgi:CubicO group peptidase (beta-lactamase class C family)